MLGKYYSFFILKCINNVINQKKKEKKKNIKFDMRSSVKRHEYISRWVRLSYGYLKKTQSTIQLDLQL